jgi:hypothetical protein
MGEQAVEVSEEGALLARTRACSARASKLDFESIRPTVPSLCIGRQLGMRPPCMACF